VIAELLRTLEVFMPHCLTDIMAGSEITDEPIEGDADELLELVRTDLEILKGCYEELMAVADDEGHAEISNYAQDQVLDIAKSIWMLSSTLD
jgi:DNA-binding ferritin-like protein